MNLLTTWGYAGSNGLCNTDIQTLIGNTECDFKKLINLSYTFVGNKEDSVGFLS